MIKNCIYHEKAFEIQFEWPLSQTVLKESPEIACFLSGLQSIDGASIVEEDDAIVGLIIPYEGWKRLLDGRRVFPGREKNISDEFSLFFTSVLSEKKE
jgi:hypothetical protein